MPNPVTLLTAATAANGAPSLTSATAGEPLDFTCDQATLLVHSTAGSGTMTATVAVWGYFAGAGRWYRLGVLNAAAAIGETSADAINYAEAVVGLRGVTRLYAEVTAIAGTATAITVQARAVPCTAVSC